MNNMKNFVWFAVLVLLCACEKIDDESSLAVSSGKMVKSICSSSDKYVYEYDENGRIMSIAYNDGLSVFNYDYSNENLLIVTGGGCTRNYIYGKSGKLETVNYVFSDEQDFGTMTFTHSGGFPAFCSVTSDLVSDRIVSEYVWEDGNLVLVRPGTGESCPADEYSYTGIVNNFNVPLPFFWSFNVNNECFIYPLMLSHNLPESIVDRHFRYDRNQEGDICKVTVETTARHDVYEVEYY